MYKPENELNQTVTPEEKAATPTKPRACASDAMLASMLEGMKLLATDENRRKALAMQWHVWVAEASKKWK